jgi:hypothetical protein
MKSRREGAGKKFPAGGKCVPWPNRALSLSTFDPQKC